MKEREKKEWQRQKNTFIQAGSLGCMNISQVWLHGQPDAPALYFIKNTDVLIKQQTSCDCSGGTA